MLCKIISHVDCSFPPNKLKTFLLNTVLDPIEFHVEGFREILSHRRVEDVSGGETVL